MDILTEKYRPTSLSQMIGNKETVHTLHLILESSQLPHLLFTGPPGTGKTTASKIIAKSISKGDKNLVLELNASNDRGIDIVRDRIKSFATKKVHLADTQYKLIILDEADSMTVAAQQALRRIMETSADTRFILICNMFTKIFEPVQSRCAVLTFDRISNLEIRERLDSIVLEEDIEIEKGGLDMIVSLCGGDMRQCINILESCRNVKADEDKIVKISGQPSPKVVDLIVKKIVEGDLERAVEIFDEMWKEKFDPLDVITSFYRSAKSLEDYEIMKIVGFFHVRIIEGVNTKLQFYAMFYELSNLKK